MNNTDTPAPDYGEPWRTKENHLSTSLYDGKGNYFADIHELVGQDSSIAWEKANRIVACVNACAGIPDPAAHMAAMREAIREAHGALFRLSEEWKYQAKIGNVPDDRVEANLSTAALTKLQPFLK
jgi:hypothetical protein